MQEHSDKTAPAAEASDALKMGVLHTEHMLLGAGFAPGHSQSLAVDAYAREPKAAETLAQGALLFDLTGATYELMSGPAAPALAEATLAGQRLAVGECAFEACLTAEGNLAAAPLTLRCGDHEYALLDPSPRGAVAKAWIGFVSQVEQDGYAPYAGCSLEDASHMLVPLLLAGAKAGWVLRDYLAPEARLPRAGEVASLALDAIQVVAAGVPLPGKTSDTPCYLLLVPPARARVLWRSLLSFTEVEPAGHRQLLSLCEKALPWAPVLATDDAVRPGRSRLASWGLVRPEDDFVGARRLEP